MLQDIDGFSLVGVYGILTTIYMIRKQILSIIFLNESELFIAHG